MPCFDRVRFLIATRRVPWAVLIVMLALWPILGPAAETPPTSPTPAAAAPCETATDCLDLALERKAAGMTASAVEILRFLQDRYPASVAASRATFVLAQCYRTLDDNKAVETFLRVLVDTPELGDYALIELGDRAFDREVFVDAAKSYHALLAMYPDSLLAKRAMVRMAGAYTKSRQWKRALEAMNGFAKRFPGDSQMPEVRLMTADCRIGLGQPDQAIGVLRRIRIEYPNHAAAKRAEKILGELSVAKHRVAPLTVEERLERAQNLYAAGAYREAIEAWKDLLGHGAPRKTRSDIRFKIATAKMKLRDDVGARELLMSLLSRRQTPAMRIDALGQLARIHYQLGDESSLVKTVGELQELSPSAPETVRATLLQGYWWEEQKKYGEAAKTFQKALGLAPADALADESLWHVGWCRYLAGDYGGAAEIFAGFPSAYPNSPMVPQTMYWEGRSLDAAGQAAEAEKRYRDLCSRFRFTYYCQRASARISLADPVPPAAPDRGIEEKGQASYEDDGHYQRAVALAAIRMNGEAAAEIDAALTRLAKDPVVLAELNAKLYDLGDYRRALKNIKLRYDEVLSRGDDNRPLSFWVQAYPMGRMRQIEAAVPADGADPYLVAAVVREESAYDPQAVSIVGALGLMQLMPETAQRAAARVPISDFRTSSLFDPETNIRLGAWYLSFLLERYGGNRVYAVAAYNAGSTAVDGWIANLGTADSEAFTESIPYRETRNFVKRVLRSAGEYRRIATLVKAASPP